VKVLAAFGIVTGGSVAAFAVYAFGWHDDCGTVPGLLKHK
jgi:hypothetical protein